MEYHLQFLAKEVPIGAEPVQIPVDQFVGQRAAGSLVALEEEDGSQSQRGQQGEAEEFHWPVQE